MNMYVITPSWDVWVAYVFAETRGQAKVWAIRWGYVEPEDYIYMRAYKLLSDIPRWQAGAVANSDAYSPYYQRWLQLNGTEDWSTIAAMYYPDEEV